MNDQFHEINQKRETVMSKLRKEENKITEAKRITRQEFLRSDHSSSGLERLYAQLNELDEAHEKVQTAWQNGAIEKAKRHDRAGLTNSEVGFLIGKGFIREGGSYQFGSPGRPDNDYVTTWEFTDA